MGTFISINLGHTELLFKSDIQSCACTRRKKRALERSSQEIDDQKTANGKVEKNNEATASTNNTLSSININNEFQSCCHTN